MLVPHNRDLKTNPNTFFSAIFIEELANCGLSAVCLAPGSRSTPLVLAFAANPAVRIYRHLDERSAGYFALGMAQATKRPVALVCTSGTAAANFHPAIIEAYYSHIPLIVMTADRPPELRQSGANQTIDQIKMYGDHVRWSVEVPIPQNDAPAIVLRHMRTLAARAYATANGAVKGPVHLNFPFRKPLEPEWINHPHAYRQSPSERSQPYSRISTGKTVSDEVFISLMADELDSRPNGLIVCGPDCPNGTFPAQVRELSQVTGYPILADPLSNLRGNSQPGRGAVLGGYNLWLPALGDQLPQPQVILRFGAVPTSAALAAYLGALAPDIHVHIRDIGEWADDQHLTREFVNTDPARFCHDLSQCLRKRGTRSAEKWTHQFTSVEEWSWQALDRALDSNPFFDAVAVRYLLEALPKDSRLFAGNSMPVRLVDMLIRPTARRTTVYGNRGASGIDGNVSTALGLAATTNRPVIALLGDITFYHDMNGLLAVRQESLTNITFVVLNNNGGAIFRRLPIARHEPPFTELFLTPHGLTFDYAAAMYGLKHFPVKDLGELTQALSGTFASPQAPTLIEILTDGANDYSRYQAVQSAVATELRARYKSN